MTAASQLCWADPGQGREMTGSLVLCKLQWYSCKQGWPRTQFPWLRGGRLGDPFPGNPPSCQWPVAPAEAARSPEQRAWWKAAALRALELQLEGHGSALLKKCRLSPRKATRLRANSLDEADVFSDPSHGISRLQSFQRGLAMTLLDWNSSSRTLHTTLQIFSTDLVLSLCLVSQILPHCLLCFGSQLLHENLPANLSCSLLELQIARQGQRMYESLYCTRPAPFSGRCI